MSIENNACEFVSLFYAINTLYAVNNNLYKKTVTVLPEEITKGSKVNIAI